MVGRSECCTPLVAGKAAPCGIVVTLCVVDGEAGTQALARRLRHHDHLIGQCHHRLEHRTLLRCRVFEHRVGDDDGRHAQRLHDLDDLVAVGAAVDAVLVLDDRDVAAVEQFGGGSCGRGVAVDEFADDAVRLSRPRRRRCARR